MKKAVLVFRVAAETSTTKAAAERMVGAVFSAITSRIGSATCGRRSTLCCLRLTGGVEIGSVAHANECAVTRGCRTPRARPVPNANTVRRELFPTTALRAGASVFG